MKIDTLKSIKKSKLPNWLVINIVSAMHSGVEDIVIFDTDSGAINIVLLLDDYGYSVETIVDCEDTDSYRYIVSGW